MPVDANSSFWAGHLNETSTSRPPPYFPSPSTLAPYNAAAGEFYHGSFGFAGVGDRSAVDGNIGNDFADRETRGVYGNYTDGESQERENKKARVERNGVGKVGFDDYLLDSTGNNGGGGISRDESEKQVVDGVNVAGDDVEMIE